MYIVLSISIVITILLFFIGLTSMLGVIQTTSIGLHGFDFLVMGSTIYIGIFDP
jgi:hypothetical protein